MDYDYIKVGVGFASDQSRRMAGVGEIEAALSEGPLARNNKQSEKWMGC